MFPNWTMHVNDCGEITYHSNNFSSFTWDYWKPMKGFPLLIICLWVLISTYLKLQAKGNFTLYEVRFFYLFKGLELFSFYLTVNLRKNRLADVGNFFLTHGVRVHVFSTVPPIIIEKYFIIFLWICKVHTYLGFKNLTLHGFTISNVRQLQLIR